MGRAHEKSSQSMLLFLMQKNQITCIKNEVMVILLIEKVIDNKMFPKSTAGYTYQTLIRGILFPIDTEFWLFTKLVE